MTSSSHGKSSVSTPASSVLMASRCSSLAVCLLPGRKKCWQTSHAREYLFGGRIRQYHRRWGRACGVPFKPMCAVGGKTNRNWPLCFWLEMPSRPREFHPGPLTDPEVNLSHHPAHAITRRLPPHLLNHLHQLLADIRAAQHADKRLGRILDTLRNCLAVFHRA